MSASGRTTKTEPTDNSGIGSCRQRKQFNQVRHVNVRCAALIMLLCHELIHIHVLPRYGLRKKGYARPGLMRMCGTHSQPHGGRHRGEARRSQRKRQGGAIMVVIHRA